MPIYRIHNRNILFIHVPKTGGTSIEAFLKQHAEPALHNQGVKLLRPVRDALLSPWLAMQHFHGELLEGMFPQGYFDYAFMVVRHPLQRMVSEYGHSRQLGRPDSRLPFNVWSPLMLTLSGASGHFSNNHYRPQHEFHCFDAEVFRFEDGIPSILAQLAGRLGLPAPDAIPHKKSSSISAPAISGRTRRAIERRYARDYAQFGYATGPAPENGQ